MSSRDLLYKTVPIDSYTIFVHLNSVKRVDLILSVLLIKQFLIFNLKSCYLASVSSINQSSVSGLQDSHRKQRNQAESSLL